MNIALSVNWLLPLLQLHTAKRARF